MSFLTRLPVSEIAVQGALAHAGNLCDFRHATSFAVVHLQGEVYQLGIQRRMPSEPPPGMRSSYPLYGSLPDQLSLKLADAGEESEQEPPMRRRGVKPGLFQRLDLGPGLVYLPDNVEQVSHGAAESRQLGDDYDIAIAQSVEHSFEFWPVTLRAAHLLFKDSFTPILTQLVTLPVQVLVLGGDPSISYSHYSFPLMSFVGR